MPLMKDSPEYKQLVDLVQRGKRSVGGNQSELARRIGVSPQRISGWINHGYEPPAGPYQKLMELVQQYEMGDSADAAFMAHEEPASYGRTDSIRMIGKVSAGSLIFSDSVAMSFDDVWQDSPWRRYIDTSQPIQLLRVHGDSMAPMYPDKSWIAVGRPGNAKLPNGTPCVFRDGEEVSFKLLLNRADGGMAGLPLNQEFNLVQFNDPVIDYVAIGSIQLSSPAAVVFSPPPEKKSKNR